MKAIKLEPKHPEHRLEQILRQKFVVISFSVVFVVLFVIALVVNCFNYFQVRWKAEELIEIIAENNGTFPQLNYTMPPEMGGTNNMEPRTEDEPNRHSLFLEMGPRVYEESSYTTRFFTVKFNLSEEVVGVDTSKIQRISPPEAETLGKNVLKSGHNHTMDDFYYAKVLYHNPNEILVVFLDVSEDLYFFRSFLYSSVAICLVALLCVFVLLVFLSKKAVSPIVKTYARQKEFITDMSHELKTPLAIVKANTEVLELEHGGSTWTKSNHKQIEKLNNLIVRLLSLAKLEEDVVKGQFQELSLSLLCGEAGEFVSVLAQQQGKELHTHIEPHISFYGDPNGLRQLLDILLENAVKYSADGSEILLTLQQTKHNIQIVVKNTCPTLKKGTYDHWFQRFYREEGSRNSETGGFGLGLSMAKTLVKNHEGKISATCPVADTVVMKCEFKYHHKKEKE